MLEEMPYVVAPPESEVREPNAGFFTALCLALLAGLLLVLGINVWWDPYGLYPQWHSLEVERGNRYLADERSAKPFEFEWGAFDGALLGGSRVAFMDTHELDSLLGQRLYNFGIGSLGLGELDAYARRIARSGSTKTLILGLNFYHFSKNDDLWGPISPDVVRGTPPGLIQQFLSVSLSWDSLVRTRNLLTEPVSKRTNPNLTTVKIDERGNRLHGVQKPERRALGWKRVIREFDDRYRQFVFDEARIRLVQRLVVDLSDRGIRCVVYIPPISIDLLARIEKRCPGDFQRWKRELAQVTSYFDFCYENDVTADPDNFYDPSHAKTEVGPKLFQRMFGPQDASSDFGRWVEKAPS